MRVDVGIKEMLEQMYYSDSCEGNHCKWIVFLAT